MGIFFSYVGFYVEVAVELLKCILIGIKEIADLKESF